MFNEGYTSALAVDGGGEEYPDYRKAFQRDRYLGVAITEINSAFQEAGYPIQDMNALMSRLDFASVERGSDRAVQQSFRDQILQTAKSDILLELDFFEERIMGQVSIAITIDAKDAYSSQAIASVTNTGKPSAATPFSSLVREAVIQNMPLFEQKLMDHFSSLLENGRVGTIEVTLSDGAPFDLEEWVDIGDGEEDELGFVIKDMIRKKAMNSEYHVFSETRTMQIYDVVRVPLFDDDGFPLDVATWANTELVRPLRRDFNLDVRTETTGLGQARLIIIGYR
jgi:hypothetical protein